MQLMGRYSKVQQIVASLRQEIARGEHGDVDTPFMTVRAIAEEFQISLVTAQRVVAELQNIGVLKTTKKRLHIAFREELTAATTKTYRFAVLTTNIDNPFFYNLLNSIEMAGRKRDIEIFSACSSYDLEREKSQLAMLQDSGANGFLICPAHDEHSAPALSELKLPFVLIGRQLKNFDSDVVMVHDFDAGRLVARHLLESGCDDFLYVGLNNFDNDLRLEGFQYELQRNGIALSAEHVIRVDNRTLDSTLNPKTLAAIYSGKKTGLFCYHDLLAMRMLRCARICQWKVPHQLSIVGFDNLPIASEVFPSLSSVAYPIRQIAENAVELLLERVNGIAHPGHSIRYLNAELVVRESSCDFSKGGTNDSFFHDKLFLPDHY